MRSWKSIPITRCKNTSFHLSVVLLAQGLLSLRPALQINTRDLTRSAFVVASGRDSVAFNGTMPPQHIEMLETVAAFKRKLRRDKEGEHGFDLYDALRGADNNVQLHKYCRRK